MGVKPHSFSRKDHSFNILLNPPGIVNSLAVREVATRYTDGRLGVSAVPSGCCEVAPVVLFYSLRFLAVTGD